MERWLHNEFHKIGNNLVTTAAASARSFGGVELNFDWLEVELENGALTLAWRLDSTSFIDPERSALASQVRALLNDGTLGEDVVRVQMPSDASYAQQAAQAAEERAGSRRRPQPKGNRKAEGRTLAAEGRASRGGVPGVSRSSSPGRKTGDETRRRCARSRGFSAGGLRHRLRHLRRVHADGSPARLRQRDGLVRESKGRKARACALGVQYRLCTHCVRWRAHSFRMLPHWFHALVSRARNWHPERWIRAILPASNPHNSKKMQLTDLPLSLS